MKRIYLPTLALLFCALSVSALVAAQSGRRLAGYAPEQEVNLIFDAESQLKWRLADARFRLTSRYETPVDGKRYERQSLVEVTPDGGAFERRKLSRRSDLTKVSRVAYLTSGLILDPGWKVYYSLAPAGEPGSWYVNPKGFPEGERLFRGQIWTDKAHRIVRARGEFLPRWREGLYALACEHERRDGLPYRFRCDDLMPVPERGESVQVKAELTFTDFQFFRSSVNVLDIGDTDKQ